MHLLVGDTTGPRVQTAATSGVLKTIMDEESTPEGVINAIFIRVLSRTPTTSELETMLDMVREAEPSVVYKDIFAGLLNSSEFLLITELSRIS
ncbi:MAG: hypothetical protein R3C05_28975 [Pirellulaceae bacterium]